MNEENTNPPVIPPEQQPDVQMSQIITPSGPETEVPFPPSQVSPPTAQPQSVPTAAPVQLPPSEKSMPVADTQMTPDDIPSGSSRLTLLKEKLFDFRPKQLVIKGVMAVLFLILLFAALILTKTIALQEFTKVNYKSASGSSYTFDFYTKHKSNMSRSGNMQLISRVSKNGKLPIAVSISSSVDMEGYNQSKDCIGLTKVFDVQITSLNQNISVCDNSNQAAQGTKNSIYIAGFILNEKAHIVTISQDYDEIDLTKQQNVKESRAKFGMQAYKADIERIISSITVE